MPPCIGSVDLVVVAGLLSRCYFELMFFQSFLDKESWERSKYRLGLFSFWVATSCVDVTKSLNFFIPEAHEDKGLLRTKTVRTPQNQLGDL